MASANNEPNNPASLPAEFVSAKKRKEKDEAMRGIKLKRVAEILWKSPTVAEKTPIVLKKNTVTENGTIAMDRAFSSDDIFKTTSGKKLADDSIESRKEEASQSMSPLRKLCFFLSLNGGVLYFVVLAWLLPCRQWSCSEFGQQWQFNLTNMQVTTNLETNSMENPTLLVFGYTTDESNELSALRIMDGNLTWSKKLPGRPLHIFCNLNKFGQRGTLACLVAANNFIEVFNPENGLTIWSRNITSDQMLSKVIVTHEAQNKVFLVGVSNDYMHVMDVMNGSELLTTKLPCSWTVGVKVTGPWMTKKGYMWSLICEYEDGLEVFTFKEKDLLSTSKVNNAIFKSLFSHQSYSGSIDLSGDVTSTPHSLVLSWANMVTMVSAQAPFHHFQKTWERHFSGPRGSPQEVTSISVGNFEDAQNTFVAAAVKEGPNSTIHFLDIKNGSSVHEAELASKSVLWMRKIPGLKGEIDKIVIETVDRRNSSSKENENTSLRKYFLLGYNGEEVDLIPLATVEGVDNSLLITSIEGNSNLLLARTTPDGTSIINRFPIESRKPKDTFCKDLKNTSTVLLLE